MRCEGTLGAETTEFFRRVGTREVGFERYAVGPVGRVIGKFLYRMTPQDEEGSTVQQQGKEGSWFQS